MSRRARAVAISVALVALVAFTGSAAGYSILVQSDLSGNGRAETWLIDDTLDGRADRLIADANEDGYIDGWVNYDGLGRPATAWADLNYTGKYEMVVQPVYGTSGTAVGQYWFSDANEDGRFENIYWDGQLDGIYEQVMVDTNLDGSADTWRQSVAPADPTWPYTPAHNIARNNFIVHLQRTYGCAFFCVI
jgi:hypothetical protein